MPRKSGKADYLYQKNYRKANCLQKFFYIYGNPVVDSVSANKGVLKMENIEDIKTSENETTRLV